ncbi:CDP-alcohol phosphatidyltransferase family protein [Gilliamella apicola]|uniref:CDP-alcohol phosphatidyltransferase n=2 Tax=Gilliamella apicola TaxID=1196095 RepID=X2H508_9GAMM|nr:CDP-alcohol phosphatidyltransferase family protein [Gilliamella apicola]AHN26168.1 CDP-diacylglycerol--glycerol-3-phosphate 3-phosphatidyltransferase [Gilliamella apicola]OTP81997.1 CDP-alcohol phosphatidyltransferase [Gilliamella apicola]OTP85546.1 CDP-alcohol phosphatidyltransferase [Gilliamella apicola]OTP89702.1 CDP-alcohol phosphatidyltransferase [Gilliamella apicola]OTP99311.1 CDP-alcohol phosphatidyltransferase [Gilliamella apicola]
MISIYQLKPKFQSLLRPCANRLNNANITANQVTISACLGSIFVSFIVGLFSSYQWIFCVIPIWMLIRMALNAIDGMLAREFQQKTDLGAYLNEIGDVISDIALLLVFMQLDNVSNNLVILVVLLSFLSEYAGVLGLMVGSSRRYDGPMGKSDRAFVFGAISLGIGIYQLPLDCINPILWMISFLLIYTVINRIRKGLEKAQK